MSSFGLRAATGRFLEKYAVRLIDIVHFMVIRIYSRRSLFDPGDEFVMKMRFARYT